MSGKRDISALTELAGLRFRAVQAEMAEILKREAALRRNLEQLTQSKAAQSEALQRVDQPALIAGADIRWQRWVDQRRTTINTELAQVLAQKENCRLKLTGAFGRDQAAQALHKRQHDADRIRQRRRTDYES